MTPDAAAQPNVPRGNVIDGDPRSRGEAKVGEAAQPRLIAGLIAFLVALVVIGPMFSAQPGPVDDHQIPQLQAFLADRGFLGALARWYPETAARFRPLYWPLYLGEVAVWGQNMAGWAFDRLILAWWTLLAGYVALRLWFDRGPSMLGSVAGLVGPQAAAFYMFGAQEAFAVPLALTSLALVGRRRFALGLVLAVAAALVKEPFMLTSALTVAWAWHLGARRQAIGAGSIIALAAVVFVGLTIELGPFYPSGIPLAARYLFPAVFLVGFALAWLASRRMLMAPLATALGAAALWAMTQSSAWAGTTVAWQAGLAEVRAAVAEAPGPLIVTGPAEPAAAVPVLVQAPATGPCIGVTIEDYPAPSCPTVVAILP